jgi:hypothetical protein
MFSVLSFPSFFTDTTGMALEQFSFGPELNVMASKHNSLGPATNRLKFPDQSAAPLSLNHRDLETLFAPLFDDSFESSAHHVSTVSAAQPDNILLPDTTATTSTTVATVAPPIETTTNEQTASNNEHVADDQNEPIPTHVDYDGNAFFNPFSPAPTIPDIAESSSSNLDPSNLHVIYQHHPSTHQWTRDVYSS